MPRGLPNLQDVVVRCGREVPFRHGTPGQVTNTSGVSAVDEEKLGWAVLSVVRCLLFSDGSQIPDVHAAISSSRSKVNGRVRGPCHLKDIIGVGFERVEFQRQLPDVPQANGL